MTDPLLPEIHSGLRAGPVIPLLGPGILASVVDQETGAPMPVEHEPLILALNNGRPLSPRLMTEFSRAAMHVEHKRGRAVLELLLTRLYGARRWSRAPAHEWLARLKPPYVIDLNRDTQLQESYAATPHLLVMGTARIMGGPWRFRLFQHDGTGYAETAIDSACWELPVLFKPLGTPLPVPNYIASDADFVDYLTELMGGFAVPAPLKTWRRQKRYLLLGMRFTHDTERMLFSDLAYDAAAPAGWAFIPEPTPKERRYCEKKGITLVEGDGSALFTENV
jgi:hypothetical protein